MEKLKKKKNKSEKEVSDVKEKSETKQKKSAALSKEEKKSKKEKAVETASKSSVSKKSDKKDEKEVSWNPFTKEGRQTIRNWFKGLQSEWFKIIWPTKIQIYAYTVIVLLTLLGVSIYLFFLGKIFEWLFKGAGIV